MVVLLLLLDQSCFVLCACFSSCFDAQPLLGRLFLLVSQGVVDALGRDFDSLRFLFVGLLMPQNIPSGRMWLERSRLWRFILLQSPQGCAYPHTQRATQHDSQLPRFPCFTHRVSSRCMVQQNTTQRPTQHKHNSLHNRYFDCTDGIALALNAKLPADMMSAAAGADCPLTVSAAAVRLAMPEIRAEGDLNDEEGRLRLWVRAGGAPMRLPALLAWFPLSGCHRNGVLRLSHRLLTPVPLPPDRADHRARRGCDGKPAVFLARGRGALPDHRRQGGRVAPRADGPQRQRAGARRKATNHAPT